MIEMLSNPNKPFKDSKLSQNIAKAIKASVQNGRRYRIMEVCGTHTVSIARYGLRTLLPDNVELVSGPGCPVCVTSQAEIDLFFTLAERGATLATFGDLLRVPGSVIKNGKPITLLDKRSEGAKVLSLYSPLDLIKLAKENPFEEYIFLGIGFETTAPNIASLIYLAEKEGIKNISVLSFCKTMPKAIEYILNTDTMNNEKLDGFLCPGHVTAITGVSLYEPIVASKKAAVVAGFEPVEILDAIYEIVRQCNEEDYRITNKYTRIVKDSGNKRALEILNEVFEPSPALWRGLGKLPASGLSIREKYSHYDAFKKYDLKLGEYSEIKGCKCGEVLLGKIKPNACPLFGKRCTSENPIGPCMVSNEGTCSAYYKFLR